jgi:hypothetical protein
MPQAKEAPTAGLEGTERSGLAFLLEELSGELTALVDTAEALRDVDLEGDCSELSSRLPQALLYLEDLKGQRLACLKLHKRITLELAKELSSGSKQEKLPVFTQEVLS